MEEEPRIGVFVCNCGINIGGVVNVEEVVEYATTLPNVVVSRSSLYTCSDSGQGMIKDDIDEFKLNRVIVASCSPRMHEPTFRKVIEEKGLNKYVFEQANLREHVSWVHSKQPEEATKKAKDLVRMAVTKARLLESLPQHLVDVKGEALVIGGGISGLTAAKSIADRGFKVHLVEKTPNFGGKMAQLYKVFPMFDDPQELLNPLVEDIMAHPNITPYLSAEIADIEGYIGNYRAIIREQTEEKEIEFGTIIVATGFNAYDPNGEFKYGKHQNILTAMELHQLMRADGPTQGNLVTPAEGKPPRSIALISCVGSRQNENTVPEGKKPNAYCSRVCCTGMIATSMEMKEKASDADIFVLYRDLRTHGKGHEELFTEFRQTGSTMIRYTDDLLPTISITQGTEYPLSVTSYDSLSGLNVEIPVDLVVLATGMIPDESASNIASKLHITISADGFFQELHPKLAPLDSVTDGVYLAGTAQGPKDVPDSVSQSLGAAAKACAPMALGQVEVESTIAVIDEDFCTGCGVCQGSCEFSAIVFEERDEGKKVSKVLEALCKGCGTCGSSCPSAAITMLHFKDAQLDAMVKAALTPQAGEK
ncbi:MAG: CoB--CoM heterodisulfide reductase iron-sulfur subunit A family protein [Candidatus Lokiarchaeota archaeon]|nr:CoB--CoM heterodisulfide reductase iron-sulfur subunit A family protein [Candidatus Lokiarchaeota archaeon]